MIRSVFILWILYSAMFRGDGKIVVLSTVRRLLSFCSASWLVAVTRIKHFNLVSHSQDGEDVECSLLGCDSISEKSLASILKVEHGDDTFFRKVSNHL
jgi:hypothetical protein